MDECFTDKFIVTLTRAGSISYMKMVLLGSNKFRDSELVSVEPCVDNSVVLDPFVANYKMTVERVARAILTKMLNNGADQAFDYENEMINEYADILYAVFPDNARCVQDLYAALNTLKESGVIVKVDTNPGFGAGPVFSIDGWHCDSDSEG